MLIADLEALLAKATPGVPIGPYIPSREEWAAILTALRAAEDYVAVAHVLSVTNEKYAEAFEALRNALAALGEGPPTKEGK